jgi:glutamate-1-semialdehyde 2,1-aminomutase
LKIVAVVQARVNATRLPNKVMRTVTGVPLIGLLLQRLARSRRLTEVVVATGAEPANAPLVQYVSALGYRVIQGSELDVLARYAQAAHSTGADVVVRITGDCPLTDPALVDEVIAALLAAGADYASNVQPPSYPDGLDIEAFSAAALGEAHARARDARQREHVTSYLRESPQFRRVNVASGRECAAARWTVDEPEDLEVITGIFEHFQPRRDFSWLEVLSLSEQRPAIFAANSHLARNEGATLGSGQKLWRRAKRVIPGGNMMLSKRAEMFLPEQWPTYFSRARGCRVWDLDGRELVDMSLMGIGTNTLGYGHQEVDDAVRNCVELGNMSTLNCPEEVALAERLVELHPWAQMVRLARSGGEANAIAVRIARAASGKHKVAVCGYHGWHDWYLAANLGDDTRLAGHLLPGLQPSGVPPTLRGSVYPFNYNRFDELTALVAEHDIGVIKMEVARNQGPEPGFLERVRQLASARGIVLIFDECTSGFRQTFGGLHKLYGVEPDMALFGKALGNGYAITAVVGRREVMEAAQNSFISSTFWTERIGPTAALKALEVMERVRSWEIITAIGERISRGWRELADHHRVPISISGLPALCGFTFAGQRHLEYRTLLTQEMLDRGYLAATNVYTCIEHRPEVLDGYFDALQTVFGLVRECEDGRDIASLLRGPVCHSGFKRLN